MNNQITLVGFVGKAPELVSFGDSGNKVAKFTLGVKEFSSNSDVESTMWVNVDAWNNLAERVLKCMTVGREVVLVGRLAIAHYNKDVNGVSVKMTAPSIKLTSFHLCGKKPENKEQTTTPAKQSTRKPALAKAG